MITAHKPNMSIIFQINVDIKLCKVTKGLFTIGVLIQWACCSHCAGRNHVFQLTKLWGSVA